ncbi:protein kinase-like domain, Phloem protein 2-like protein [Artemisia annua]|uniref:Protein kinase-like domain, Phloem protein 2-like protein n=1 Tax=Artemisia annua TaxID=35608 RepID=A0A2U1L2U2_ARTAN|nr:protein kinase-like domain, Phloem protein 2-like protein [Artemisia annua]
MATFLNNFQHLEIQLQEIISATNNFDDSKVIGSGGFGIVYKGELSHPEGKIMVAFKRLDRKYGQGDPEFFKEIRMLSCYKHKNLISLLGYCKEGDEMILMYEHASQGSLDRILNDANLTWSNRLKICLDAAKGLSFLHDPNGSQQRVIHRDIKSANILLDENLNAKVSDFGLSKISPANQKITFLVTSPVGTPGYCDPLYMDDYQLTKESDVYSFGVVLFEVLCGRVCFENSNGTFKVFVNHWKRCYEQNKLDEIIFPDLNHQTDSSSVRTFVDIAYQCLQKSREQRPTMSVVVEKLKAALEQREHEQEQICKAAEHMRKAAEQEQMRKAAEQEYKEILKSANPPLRFLEFRVNGGKTLLSINDKGEVFCERIRIEACLNQIQYDSLEDPFDFENSRFSGGRCYCKHEDELKVRVRAQFLYPQITYSANIVFRNAERTRYCKTLHYKVNGETKCCMVYDTYEREDGWFVVPLYQFTSENETADFEINFEGFRNGGELLVAGFEFQPLEEKVELHDQGLEEYQDIVKAASQSLFYKSLEELKVLLSMGVYLNGYKTWFSLHEDGEHCEMLSIAHCLISREGGYSFYHTYLRSRFPHFFETGKKGFKVHIRTQFLTPSIRYTVNLVFCTDNSNKKQKYVALRYKLEGETETSIVYLATETQDGYSFIAELYQFTSNGRTFDLEIVFEDHTDNLEVEGILFQPLGKVEHEQVLEDEKLSNDSLQWTIKKGLFSNLLKRSSGQKGYAVDNNGKKSLMISARGVITSRSMSFMSLLESRFGEVAVITYNRFYIEKKIKSDVVSPETTYACYLVYKSTEDQPILKISYPDDRYIYLVSPKIPIVGQKLDQNTRSQPLKRPKLDYFPRQRSDGWMEVKVRELQTPSAIETINIDISLWTPDDNQVSELIIQSIELRPIVVHSV